MRRGLAAACVLLAAAYAQDRPLTGAQLVRLNRLPEALSAFRADLELAPKSVAANNGVGVVLDLLGRYDEARPYFAKAIKVAPSNSERVGALRAMAIAWGFAGNCRNAEKYEQEAFDLYIRTNDYPNAGDTADEMGRLCIDTGDFALSRDWYSRGHDAGLDEPNIAPARRDLWNFRWEHAQARLDIRQGKSANAARHVENAKAILAKGTIPDQAEFLPYLTGYVAFYSGNYKEALEDLKYASLADPFIQCLMAQTYEKLGDTVNARKYYEEAASTTAHSVPAAYARPFAVQKLH
ncbi:MAG TPA: tetratricopeptide repeat protein [Bryobacteraceae bacterium]|nr:tetratricopeptide repeat protein [Bryobacteraceae bacterium]